MTFFCKTLLVIGNPTFEAVLSRFLRIITPAIFNLYRYLVNVKNRVDISMFEDEMDDENEVMTHDCHDCGGALRVSGMEDELNV